LELRADWQARWDSAKSGDEQLAEFVAAFGKEIER
jgi:hypothetical protein